MKTLVKMSFNPDIAKDVGTDAAIILENIAYWIDKNQANQMDRDNKSSFHNGKWWTYNSALAFSRQFIWLSKKQIERIIKKLEKKNYLESGNFNKVKYDRTKWYALGNNPFLESYISISRNREIETTIKRNQSDISVAPIPNSNTDYKSVCGGTHTQEKKSDKEVTISDVFNSCKPYFKSIAVRHGLYESEVARTAENLASYMTANQKWVAKPYALLNSWVSEDISKGKYDSGGRNR
jgi:hypothetical protein